MGTLGFLTPFDVAQYQSCLTQVPFFREILTKTLGSKIKVCDECDRCPAGRMAAMPILHCAAAPGMPDSGVRRAADS